MNRPLPDVQYNFRPGIIELKAGYPDVTLLPAEGLSQAAQVVLEREAFQALLYGAQQGPGCLITQVKQWMEPRENYAVPPEQMLITGGTSQALDMLCQMLTQPGDIVLVQTPTYNLALRLLREYHLDLIPVQSDEEGIIIEELVERLRELEQQGRQPRFLYLVPTFSNPGTLTVPLERRKAVVELAQRYTLRIIEDDAYCDLWYESPPPSSMYSLDPDGVVIHLRSFSKILAPGLRLGWMLASSELIQQCAMRGVFVSGGGANHFTAHVVAAFMELGLLDQHVDTLRARYRERRDILEQALSTDLAETCQWSSPQGGFFLWLQLPESVKSDALVSIAKLEGVSFLPGTLCFVNGGGENFCRLTFTMAPPDELKEGVRRLQKALYHYRKHVSSHHR
jgi:DNA-binding transcriptional MocR family regulator